MKTPLRTRIYQLAKTVRARVSLPDVFVFACAFSIFIADLTTGRFVNLGILYPAVVVLTIYSKWDRQPIWIGALTTVFTMFVFYWGGPAHAPLAMVFLHRGIDVVSICACAWLAMRTRALQKSQLLTTETLKLKGERLRLALGAGGMGTWSFDLKTQTCQWSEEQERLFRVEPGSFRSVELPKVINLVHPADRNAMIESVEKALRDHTDYEAEYRLAQPADNTPRWMHSHGKFQYDSEGKPTRIVGITNEVTERKLSQQAIEEKTRDLESQHMRLEAILDLTPTPMLLINSENGSVTFANKAANEMAGGEFPKSVPSNAYDSVYYCTDANGRRIPNEEMPGTRIVRGEKVDAFQMDWHLPNGVKSLLMFGDTVPAMHGQPALCILTFHDISQLKKHEESLRFHISEQERASRILAQKADELAQSNAELARFAYVASHDLKEPLRMVGTYTQMLAKVYGGKLGTNGDVFIRHVTDGVKRMYALIDDLLAYSRVGSEPENATEVDCRSAYEEAIQNLSIAIQESGAQVTCDDLPRVTADRTQLVQLFQNLISNAIKYRSDQRPEIHITAKDKGDNWTFSVTDNGIGIDPSFFDRIFVLFQRLHSKEQYSGTGIGLAICKKIVERQGGRIWVESEPRRGSTFNFSIPNRPPPLNFVAHAI